MSLQRAYSNSMPAVIVMQCRSSLKDTCACTKHTIQKLTLVHACRIDIIMCMRQRTKCIQQKSSIADLRDKTNVKHQDIDQIRGAKFVPLSFRVVQLQRPRRQASPSGQSAAAADKYSRNACTSVDGVSMGSRQVEVLQLVAAADTTRSTPAQIPCVQTKRKRTAKEGKARCRKES